MLGKDFFRAEDVCFGPSPAKNASAIPTVYLPKRHRQAACLSVFDLQQLFRLGAETTQFFIPRLMLLHPWDGAVVPSPRLFLVAEFPMGHRQEKPIEAVS